MAIVPSSLTNFKRQVGKGMSHELLSTPFLSDLAAQALQNRPIGIRVDGPDIQKVVDSVSHALLPELLQTATTASADRTADAIKKFGNGTAEEINEEEETPVELDTETLGHRREPGKRHATRRTGQPPMKPATTPGMSEELSAPESLSANVQAPPVIRELPGTSAFDEEEEIPPEQKLPEDKIEPELPADLQSDFGEVSDGKTPRRSGQLNSPSRPGEKPSESAKPAGPARRESHPAQTETAGESQNEAPAPRPAFNPFSETQGMNTPREAIPREATNTGLPPGGTSGASDTASPQEQARAEELARQKQGAPSADTGQGQEGQPPQEQLAPERSPLTQGINWLTDPEIRRINRKVKQVAQEKKQIQKEINSYNRTLRPIEALINLLKTSVWALRITQWLLWLVSGILAITIVLFELAGITSSAATGVGGIKTVMKRYKKRLEEAIKPQKEKRDAALKQQAQKDKELRALAAERHQRMNQSLYSRQQPSGQQPAAANS